jgi:SAM-dependent methyltransferase
MLMEGYYTKKLAADRLERCYEIATPAVVRYLKREIGHVLEKVGEHYLVLELGCGYGRAMKPLCSKAGFVIGVDTAPQNIEYGLKYLKKQKNSRLLCMNAAAPAFCDGLFDTVVCIQNGICAFHEDKETLMREAVRITRDGGCVLFSSYSEKFWEKRLEWFYLQAQEGLLGRIDEEKTKNGVIVCTDGFEVTTETPEGFCTLATGLGLDYRITEVDRSSVFCEITVRR